MLDEDEVEGGAASISGITYLTVTNQLKASRFTM